MVDPERDRLQICRFGGAIYLTTVRDGHEADSTTVGLDLDGARALAAELIEFLRNHPEVQP